MNISLILRVERTETYHKKEKAALTPNDPVILLQQIREGGKVGRASSVWLNTDALNEKNKSFI